MQIRVKSGTDFEKEVCLQRNLTKSESKPTIKWSGEGKNNFDKIVSCNFDVDKFYPLSDSKYGKHDAINSNGDKVEIKKYRLNEIYNWNLYSEPFPCIKGQGELSHIIDKFGNGSIDTSREIFNNFIENLMYKDFSYIIPKISNSNIGIHLIDAFVPNSELEFRINIKEKEWKGFDRAKIQFKLKNDFNIKNIQTHNPINFNISNINTPVKKQSTKNNISKNAKNKSKKSVKQLQMITDIVNGLGNIEEITEEKLRKNLMEISKIVKDYQV
jgi:hypothetical protein